MSRYHSRHDGVRLDTALTYAQRGWAVFSLHAPLHDTCSYGRLSCSHPGKHPRTPQGVQDATIDEARGHPLFCKEQGATPTAGPEYKGSSTAPNAKEYLLWKTMSPSIILEKVHAVVAASKQNRPPFSPAGGLPYAWLSGGEYVLRPVLDATGELLRHLRGHYNREGKRWTHCPNAMQQSGPPGDYPRCEICALAKQRNDWRLRMEEVTLMYGHLYRTRQQSSFWKPGQTYLLLMRTTLAETIRAHLETWLETQPEAVYAMLQPHVPGPALALSVTRRPQWSLTLSLTARNVSPHHPGGLVPTLHGVLDWAGVQSGRV